MAVPEPLETAFTSISCKRYKSQGNLL